VAALVGLGSCSHHARKSIGVFPDYSAPAHYELENTELDSMIIGSLLCRVDDNLVFLHYSQLRHGLEYVVVSSLEQILDEQHYSTYYSYVTPINLHGEYRPICVGPLGNYDISSWIAPDSLLYMYWPSLDKCIFGLRAGANSGVIVYGAYESDEITVGILEQVKYTERSLKCIFPPVETFPIEPYVGYGKYCKVMILNRYLCLWFPGKQSFILLFPNNKALSITLKDMLKDTNYKDCVVPLPGLVCDDGSNLYLGLFTHQQMEEINYAPNGVPIHEGVGTMTIVQCILSETGAMDSVKRIGDCILYSQEEAMEYYQGLLLILANSEFLDTIPVNTREVNKPVIKN
jgi:hypothetical protein